MRTDLSCILVVSVEQAVAAPCASNRLAEKGARLREMEDLTTHPQDRNVSADTPAGPVRLLAPGAVIDGAPVLGAQTDALRRQFASD